LIALALLLYGRRGTLIASLKKRQRTTQRADNALILTDEIQPANNTGMPQKDELIKWS
jgi:hypothetical protein